MNSYHELLWQHENYGSSLPTPQIVPTVYPGTQKLRSLEIVLSRRASRPIRIQHNEVFWDQGLLKTTKQAFKTAPINYIGHPDVQPVQVPENGSESRTETPPNHEFFMHWITVPWSFLWLARFIRSGERMSR